MSATATPQRQAVAKATVIAAVAAAASKSVVEEPSSDWSLTKLQRYAEQHHRDAMQADELATKAGTKSVGDYLRAGQAYILIRDHLKAEKGWLEWIKEQGLKQSSISECIAFADASKGEEATLNQATNLTEARRLLGLIDVNGKRANRTGKTSPNAGNIRPMPVLEKMADTLDAFLKAAESKKHAAKIASRIDVGDARKLAQKLRDELTRLDAYLDRVEEAAKPAATK